MDNKGESESEMDRAERWRVAGRILRRTNPTAFASLLDGAEAMIAMGDDSVDPFTINFVDLLT